MAQVASLKKGVQKGFLKTSRVSKSGADMRVDELDHFAFVGFPKGVDALAACDFIKEQCYDYLKDFNLKILGFAEFSDHDSVVRAVGVEFLASQRDALDAAIYQLRDQWYFHKLQLSTVVGVAHPEVFVLPSATAGQERSVEQQLLTPDRAGRRQRSADQVGALDPLTLNDPWQSHVQLSPAILQAKQRLSAMRANLVETPPFPGESGPTNADIMTKLDRMMNAMALKEDVQVAQMEVVKQLRSEFSSQFEPLRTQVELTTAAVSCARDETKSLNDRLVKVETKDTVFEQRMICLEAEFQKLQISFAAGGSSRSSGSAQPMKSDVANSRISFKGFTNEFLDDRRKCIATFLRDHVEDVDFSYIGTRMTGPYAKKKPSDKSFIQFVCQEERDRILNIITNKKLGALRTPNGPKLTIARNKSDWIRKRDYAMRESERLITAHLHERGQQGTVQFQKTKSVRKIVVNGVDAFLQYSTDAVGEFTGDFAHLKMA